jgi:hypothetical protein
MSDSRIRIESEFTISNPRIKLDRQAIIRLLDGYPVQVATSVGLLEFEAVQTEWQPMRQRPTPPHIVRAHESTGLGADVALWSNDTYEVFVVEVDIEAGIKHLSIKRYDRAPTHNWRHLQQIKNEICGESWEAIELYPDESRLADNANQTHLWATAGRIPVGFPEGVVISDEQVQAYNEADHPGRQEPRQPGMTVGDTLRGQTQLTEDEINGRF